MHRCAQEGDSQKGQPARLGTQPHTVQHSVFLLFPIAEGGSCGAQGQQH